MINKQRNDDGLQKKTDEQNEQKFGKEFMLFDFFSFYKSSFTVLRRCHSCLFFKNSGEITQFGIADFLTDFRQSKPCFRQKELGFTDTDFFRYFEKLIPNFSVKMAER